MQIIQGDCLEVLKTLPDNSVDAIVTDPPAGVSFMNEKWDSDKGGRQQWIAWMADVARECLRVIKPGGHALVWSLPRTSHWTATAWEDGGWEIRDSILYIFGGGFPKGFNIGKAINPGVSECTQWKGWGSSLKPAYEPWWLLRKPFQRTLVENVLRHGTGGINIDKCRVGLNALPLGRFPTNLITDGSNAVVACFPDQAGGRCPKGAKQYTGERSGRNYIEGENDPSLFCKKITFGKPGYNDTGSAARFFQSCPDDDDEDHKTRRMFYCGKAMKRDKNEGVEGGNHHPTVKPTALMRYLCRLICPPGGIVLDPFMGSGSTGKAAVLEGFEFIGIELNPEYLEIAKARIAYAQKQVTPTPLKPSLEQRVEWLETQVKAQSKRLKRIEAEGQLSLFG